MELGITNMPSISPAQFAAMGGQTTQPQTTDYSPLQSFMAANKIGASVPPQQPATPPPQQPAQPNIIQKAGSGLLNFGNELKNDAVQPLESAMEGQQSGASAGLQTVGNLLNTAVVKPGNAILSPISKAWQGLTSMLNPVVDSLSGQQQGTTTANQQQATQAAADKYNQWATAHPEAAKDLEALGNIGQAGMTIAGTESAVEGAKAGLDRVTEPQVPTQSLQNIQAGANAVPETPETPTETEGKGQAPQDTLQSRINDAKPNYNKNMIGSHVMTPDITDESGQTIKGQITPRVANENTNFTGDRPVTTSASEHAAGTELNNIKDYPDNGTNLEKGLATEKAIGEEAENMRSQVAAEDKSDPLDTKAERAKVTDYVTSHLDQDEQAKFEEGKGTKTAMGKYTAQVNEAVANYDGTREGKLDLRQQLDNIYKANRGKLAFQGDSGNVLDETHTDIRDAINKDLKGSTNNTDTQASLNKQTKLYRAQDVLYEKAKAEAPNKFGRALEKAPIVGRLGNRILLREAASGILKGAGYVAAAGAGALGYEAIKNK